MKQKKHEIRCSEIEKHLGKCCFFEKSYKNTRTKICPETDWFLDFFFCLACGKLEFFSVVFLGLGVDP